MSLFLQAFFSLISILLICFFSIFCIRTLDYIFVSENVQLVCHPAVLPTVVTDTTANTNVTGMVSETVLTQVIRTPQPSRLWPSDHFIVTATLQY